MSYRIESGRIIFDTPPREGAEVEIKVSTQQSTEGFRDPNSFYPRRVNEVDTNRLAVNELSNQHPVVAIKKENVDDLTGEPKTSFGAQYPFNHVRETESGHIQEFDDTPGYERIHEYHRSGTFYEIHPDGSKVTKIVGDGYEITHGNKQVRVRGDVNVYVDGNANLYVRGDMDAQVDENLKFNVGKNIDFHAGQNIRMFANQSIEQTAQTTYSATSVGKMYLQTSADLLVNAGGDYSTNIKGNVTLVADGDGSHTYTGNYTVGSTGVMQLDTESWMLIGAGSSIDIDGSTVDLNTNGRESVTVLPATDLVFLDTGTLDSGIKAWSIDDAEYDTDGFASTIEAPKSAEVLDAKPFTPLSDSDSFHANDDEELTEDDIRAAITRGEIRPTSMADYSFNALDGTFNVNGAARRILSRPRIPTESGQHSDVDESRYTSAPEASGNTPTPVEVTDSLFDADERYIGGINYRLPLSANYKLRDVSSNAVVTKNRIIHNQHGITEKQAILNLKNIAENVLEPIKAQYSNMIVTSAYRQGSGTSQHERGQAVDMQFPGTAKSGYFEIAQWIRANVPHDQLLLEYKNTGSGLPWIHVSLKDSGNREQIMTFFNHSRYGEVGTFYQLA
jgi:hypothetical protein